MIRTQGLGKRFVDPEGKPVVAVGDVTFEVVSTDGSTDSSVSLSCWQCCW